MIFLFRTYSLCTGIFYLTLLKHSLPLSFITEIWLGTVTKTLLNLVQKDIKEKRLTWLTIIPCREWIRQGLGWFTLFPSPNCPFPLYPQPYTCKYMRYVFYAEPATKAYMYVYMQACMQMHIWVAYTFFKKNVKNLLNLTSPLSMRAREEVWPQHTDTTFLPPAE